MKKLTQAIILVLICLATISSVYASPFYLNQGGTHSTYEDAWGTRNSGYNYDNRYAFGDYANRVTYTDTYTDSGLNNRWGYGNYGYYDSGKYLRGNNRYYDCTNCHDNFYYNYINSYSDYELDDYNLYYQPTENYKKYVMPHQSYTGPGVYYKYTYQRNTPTSTANRFDKSYNVFYEYEYQRDNSNFYATTFMPKPFGMSGNQYNSFLWN